jgi:hypothetical protein
MEPRITAKDKLIGDVLWCVRSLRCEHAELTADSVYTYQRYRFRYSLEQVQDALNTVKRRGFQWDLYIEGVPDACIVVRKRNTYGEQSSDRAEREVHVS